jgi:hypothetical protein
MLTEDIETNVSRSWSARRMLHECSLKKIIKMILLTKHMEMWKESTFCELRILNIILLKLKQR